MTVLHEPVQELYFIDRRKAEESIKTNQITLSRQRYTDHSEENFPSQVRTDNRKLTDIRLS